MTAPLGGHGGTPRFDEFRIDRSHQPVTGRPSSGSDQPPGPMGSDPSGTAGQMQAHFGELTAYLMRQKKELDRRERELAARIMAWEQRHRRGHYPPPRRWLGVSRWRDRLDAASRAGLDLETFGDRA